MQIVIVASTVSAAVAYRWVAPRFEGALCSQRAGSGAQAGRAWVLSRLCSA